MLLPDELIELYAIRLNAKMLSSFKKQPSQNQTDLIMRES
ncbi:hypothetical protein VRK_29620 [Vibrio sp. MEBiC08052]|nr:hypothetical protein VRK_29620 [Vibrio sp. MEBiC08052]